MNTETPLTTRQVVETVLLDPQERRRLLTFARLRYGIGSEDAEDLLQETALDLLRQRYCVRKPQAYLFIVFNRRCQRLIRTFRRGVNPGELPENLADPGSQDAGRESTDRRFAIRQALHRISSTCRKLLTARYIEGQSLRETAFSATMVENSVGVTINRCLQRLRECMI